MAKDRFKSYKSKKLRENLKYKISSSGLTIVGDTFLSSYQWNDLKEVTEGSKAFYFWEHESFALLLPKRYMSSEEINFVRKVGNVK